MIEEREKKKLALDSKNSIDSNLCDHLYILDSKSLLETETFHALNMTGI